MANVSSNGETDVKNCERIMKLIIGGKECITFFHIVIYTIKNNKKIDIQRNVLCFLRLGWWSYFIVHYLYCL